MDNVFSSDTSINNGLFDIKYQEDGVYLTVMPPIGKGKKVELNDVLEKVNKKKIRNFSRDSIDIAVLRADKVPVKIAGNQEEEKIDARGSVIISNDKMKAFVSISPPEKGRDLLYDEILHLISDAGVIFGIDKNAVEAVAQYPVYGELICVAEGSQPVNGQSGSVEYFFDIKKDRKPTILEDGRVDFQELNLVENVKAGQRLCKLIPEVVGTLGKTVTGIDLPAISGKPAKFPKGRNVEVDTETQTLVATIDGEVTYIDGKVNVFATYEVQADVDPSTGNINFVGSVIVRGNVLAGFTVEAGGNVDVWGVVEGATIKAGGNIILKRGMQGAGKGVLISGGDIISRYIEHSNIQAKNDIKAEAIMHSYIKCGNKVELSGKKGLLVGGTCKVGKEVSAKVVGSQMATVTEIEVGVDPNLKERYKYLKEEINRMDSDIKKSDQVIVILKKLEAAGALTSDKQEMLAKSVRTKLFYSNKVVELRQEMAAIDEKLQQEAYGKVKIQGYAYPGVRVAIGTCMLYIKETLQFCTLYRDGADIRIGPGDKR